jgi:hypothetical protein
MGRIRTPGGAAGPSCASRCRRPASRRGRCRRKARRRRYRGAGGRRSCPRTARSKPRRNRSRTGPTRARSQMPPSAGGVERETGQREVRALPAFLGVGGVAHARTSSTVRVTRVVEPASSSGSRRRRWRKRGGRDAAQMVAGDGRRVLEGGQRAGGAQERQFPAQPVRAERHAKLAQSRRIASSASHAGQALHAPPRCARAGPCRRRANRRGTPRLSRS